MKNPTPCIDFAEKGITADLFNQALGGYVATELIPNHILQIGAVNGKLFRLKIRLTRWTGKTSLDQIVILSKLFWQCYPKMYERFGKVGESPREITFDIENRGYGIAWQSGKLIHLHDAWLSKWEDDFDCITHELAHAIQNGWECDKCEFEDYVEVFADVCRYLYAYNNGQYNDHQWTLGTAQRDGERKDSVRFPIWFDYFYSTPDNDLLLNYFRVSRECKYPAANWNEAWAEIFKGSALEGRDIEDIFAEYKESEFAALSSHRENGTSPLLEKYDVRRYTK